MSKLTTALILDDEETSRAVAQGVLEELGFTEIVEAQSIAQALKLLKSMAVPPQLIVLDVFMPEGDGVEFTQVLVEQNYRGGLIMMSSKDAQYMTLAATLAKGRGLKVWACLTKPVFLGDLARALEVGQGLVP